MNFRISQTTIASRTNNTGIINPYNGPKSIVDETHLIMRRLVRWDLYRGRHHGRPDGRVYIQTRSRLATIKFTSSNFRLQRVTNQVCTAHINTVRLEDHVFRGQIGHFFATHKFMHVL